MPRNVSTWFLVLSTIGLSGFLLLRKRSTRANSFDILDQSRYKDLKKYIIAQSKVESANYTSDLFKRSNNAFGMKNATSRYQLGFQVPSDQYRHYNSLLDSIQDFEFYLDYVGFPSSVPGIEAYAGNLKRLNYFESDLEDYTRALKSWL